MPSLSNLMRNVLQLGYVTDDLDAAVGFMEAKLGTVRCVRHYRSSLGSTLHGTASPERPVPSGSHVIVEDVLADEWVIDVALVNAGALNIEIIRPVSGAVRLYRTALRAGAPATFHHVAFRVDDFDEATAVIARSGRAWAQHGVSGSVRFGYLDLTAELGHFVEVMELGEADVEMYRKLEAASDSAG